MEDILRPAGLTYREFTTKGYLKGPGRFRSYLEKGFRTPTGKVELKLSTAEKFKLKPLPEFAGLPEENNPAYPLILSSAKSRYFLLSSYRWVEKIRQKEPHPFVDIHPETAATYGISAGDEVIITTKHGEIVQVARLTDAVLPQVIYAAVGWWFPEGDATTQFEWQKSNYNLLTSIKKLGKEFGTPNLKNIPCRIRKKEEA